MNATDAVIAGTVVIVGVRVIRDTASGGFEMKPVVTGFLLGTALLLVAFVSPALAKGLVIAGVVGSLIVNGPTAFKAIGKVG